MKKWLVYLLGIITGIVLTFAFAFYVNRSKNSGIIGLELFNEPEGYMEYSQFEVFQVVKDGCALAHADGSFGAIVFILPDENHKFYDDQKLALGENQRALRVGTYQYDTQMGIGKTVPAIRIVDGVKSPKANVSKDNSGITLFDKPGECVSRKNFEIQKVLESGDAIAKEIREVSYGYVFTSDLEVLMLAKDANTFYDKQIINVPNGKCARQIGSYKYKQYGKTKVIPIVEIRQ